MNLRQNTKQTRGAKHQNVALTAWGENQSKQPWGECKMQGRAGIYSLSLSLSFVG